MGKRALILGVATLLAVAVENAGGTHYVVTDLGTLGTGTASYAISVNTSGEVAGYAYTTTGTSSPHAFLYTNGTVTDISASWSTPLARATSINDNGLVVGNLVTTPTHGFIYSGGTAGTMTDMSTLSGELNGATSRAYAVTSNGTIAGAGGAGGMGWVYDGTTSYAVGKLSSSASNGAIYGVSNSQVAVGASMFGGIDPTTYPLYSYNSGGTWVAKQVFPSAGCANFINSSGVIVGESGWGASGWGQLGQHIFVATPSGGSGYILETLPDFGYTLNAISHGACAISDTGVVVGTSTDLSVVKRAFVATKTAGTWTTTDLNTLINPASGWLLQYARGISTDGKYIAGYGTIGGQTHGFRLTPALLGDATLDGTVNINDLSKVLTNYDGTPPTGGWQWADGDFNVDGTVNINDLSNVLTNYDQTAGASAAGIKAVPEPSSLLLFGVIAIGLLTCAWRRRRV
jgi:probable HAF family extracellular repeat protein